MANWNYIPLSAAQKRRERRKRRMQRLISQERFDYLKAERRQARKNESADKGRYKANQRIRNLFSSTLTSHFEGTRRTTWREQAFRCFYSQREVSHPVLEFNPTFNQEEVYYAATPMCYEDFF